LRPYERRARCRLRQSEAYEVYSALLPHEASYEHATGTLVIRQETDVSEMDGENCVSPEQATKFKHAIADFDKLQRGQ